MPINNEQHRIGIGLFNNTLQRVLTKSRFFAQIIKSLFKNFTIKEFIKPLLFRLICSVIVLVLFPFIIFFVLIFPNFFNLYNFLLVCYTYIYIFLIFIFNLLRFTSAYLKVLTKFMVQYFFFFQICTFLPFIRLALLISGDIESNPGPENPCNQNISS